MMHSFFPPQTKRKQENRVALPCASCSQVAPGGSLLLWLSETQLLAGFYFDRNGKTCRVVFKDNVLLVRKCSSSGTNNTYLGSLQTP